MHLSKHARVVATSPDSTPEALRCSTDTCLHQDDSMLKPALNTCRPGCQDAARTEWGQGGQPELITQPGARFQALSKMYVE
mmetsp:Transcript_7763/g.13320  ORF Transcript_7763/g.13320 Transcript_7763/m.13320 type:complete len:81 (-) Transcript_7763:1130-1372(-)